jgi:hypothetical protein
MVRPEQFQHPTTGLGQTQTTPLAERFRILQSLAAAMLMVMISGGKGGHHKAPKNSEEGKHQKVGA